MDFSHWARAVPLFVFWVECIYLDQVSAHRAYDGSLDFLVICCLFDLSTWNSDCQIYVTGKVP
jgi:hypothetical protein